MRWSQPAVLFCDNHVLVVNKPAGSLSVPDSSGDPSIFDRARAWVQEQYAKPGPAWLASVHRLDRPVSGVLVFARTSKAASRLSRAFAARKVCKIYWGVLPAATLIAAEAGQVQQWLRKDRRRNTVRTVQEGTDGAQEAVTDWRILHRGQAETLVEFRPKTGRSHQIRHAALAIGGPLRGDLRYGAACPLPDRSIGLHAHAIEIPHPTRPERLRIVVPPPSGGNSITWTGGICTQSRNNGCAVSWHPLAT